MVSVLGMFQIVDLGWKKFYNYLNFMGINPALVKGCAGYSNSIDIMILLNILRTKNPICRFFILPNVYAFLDLYPNLILPKVKKIPHSFEIFKNLPISNLFIFDKSTKQFFEKKIGFPKIFKFENFNNDKFNIRRTLDYRNFKSNLGDRTQLKDFIGSDILTSNFSLGIDLQKFFKLMWLENRHFRGDLANRFKNLNYQDEPVLLEREYTDSDVVDFDDSDFSLNFGAVSDYTSISDTTLSRKKLKYIFNDLSFLFAKQRFRLLFLKRKFKIFEYNEKGNSIYYSNSDFIKDYLHDSGFIDSLNIGEPLVSFSGNYGKVFSNYRTSTIWDSSPLGKSATDKLLDFSSYMEPVLNKHLSFDHSILNRGSVVTFDNRRGIYLKDFEYVFEKRLPNLTVLSPKNSLGLATNNNLQKFERIDYWNNSGSFGTVNFSDFFKYEDGLGLPTMGVDKIPSIGEPYNLTSLVSHSDPTNSIKYQQSWVPKASHTVDRFDTLIYSSPDMDDVWGLGFAMPNVRNKDSQNLSNTDFEQQNQIMFKNDGRKNYEYVPSDLDLTNTDVSDKNINFFKNLGYGEPNTIYGISSNRQHRTSFGLRDFKFDEDDSLGSSENIPFFKNYENTDFVFSDIYDDFASSRSLTNPTTHSFSEHTSFSKDDQSHSDYKYSIIGEYLRRIDGLPQQSKRGSTRRLSSPGSDQTGYGQGFFKNNMYQKINIQKISGRLDVIFDSVWSRLGIKLKKVKLFSDKFNESISRKKYLDLFNKRNDILVSKESHDSYLVIKKKYMYNYKKKMIKDVERRVLKKTFLNHLLFLNLKIRKVENLLNLRLSQISETILGGFDSYTRKAYLSEIERKQNIIKKLKIKRSWLIAKIETHFSNINKNFLFTKVIPSKLKPYGRAVTSNIFENHNNSIVYKTKIATHFLKMGLDNLIYSKKSLFYFNNSPIFTNFIKNKAKVGVFNVYRIGQLLTKSNLGASGFEFKNSLNLINFDWKVYTMGKKYYTTQTQFRNSEDSLKKTKTNVMGFKSFLNFWFLFDNVFNRNSSKISMFSKYTKNEILAYSSIMGQRANRLVSFNIYGHFKNYIKLYPVMLKKKIIFNYFYLKKNKENQVSVSRANSVSNFLQISIKTLKSLDATLDHYWASRFIITKNKENSVRFKRKLILSLLQLYSFDSRLKNYFITAKLCLGTDIIRTYKNHNNLMVFDSIISEMEKVLLRFRVVYWDLAKIFQISGHSDSENFNLFKKIKLMSVGLNSSHFGKQTINSNIKIFSLYKNSILEKINPPMLPTEDTFSKKLTIDNPLKNILKMPISLSLEKILFDFSKSSLFSSMYKTDSILSALISLRAGTYSKQSLELLKNLYLTSLDCYTKRALMYHKENLKILRSAAGSEIYRISSLVGRRDLKIKQLNTAKRLINSLDAKPLESADTYSKFYNLRNKYKLDVVKKKFISIVLKIRYLNSTLSMRYFNLYKIRSNISKEKLKILEIMLTYTTFFLRVGQSSNNSKSLELLFLRFLFLKLTYLGFNFSTFFKYFSKKKILFENIELKRRILRKFYSTLWSRRSGFGSSANLKKTMEYVLNNFTGVVKLLKLSDFSDILIYESERSRKENTLGYKKAISSKFKLLRRFGNVNNKLQVTSKTPWYWFTKKIKKNINSLLPNNDQNNKFPIKRTVFITSEIKNIYNASHLNLKQRSVANISNFSKILGKYYIFGGLQRFLTQFSNNVYVGPASFNKNTSNIFFGKDNTKFVYDYLNFTNNGNILESLKSAELVSIISSKYSQTLTNFRDYNVLVSQFLESSKSHTGVNNENQLSQILIAADLDELLQQNNDSNLDQKTPFLINKSAKLIASSFFKNRGIRIWYDFLNSTLVISKQSKYVSNRSATEFITNALNTRVKKIIKVLGSNYLVRRPLNNVTELGDLVRYNKTKFKYWFSVNNMWMSGSRIRYLNRLSKKEYSIRFFLNFKDNLSFFKKENTYNKPFPFQFSPADPEKIEKSGKDSTFAKLFFLLWKEIPVPLKAAAFHRAEYDSLFFFSTKILYFWRLADQGQWSVKKIKTSIDFQSTEFVKDVKMYLSWFSVVYSEKSLNISEVKYRSKLIFKKNLFNYYSNLVWFLKNVRDLYSESTILAIDSMIMSKFGPSDLETIAKITKKRPPRLLPGEHTNLMLFMFSDDHVKFLFLQRGLFFYYKITRLFFEHIYINTINFLFSFYINVIIPSELLTLDIIKSQIHWFLHKNINKGWRYFFRISKKYLRLFFKFVSLSSIWIRDSFIFRVKGPLDAVLNPNFYNFYTLNMRCKLSDFTEFFNLFLLKKRLKIHKKVLYKGRFNFIYFYLFKNDDNKNFLFNRKLKFISALEMYDPVRVRPPYSLRLKKTLFSKSIINSRFSHSLEEALEGISLSMGRTERILKFKHFIGTAVLSSRSGLDLYTKFNIYKTPTTTILTPTPNPIKISISPRNFISVGRLHEIAKLINYNISNGVSVEYSVYFLKILNKILSGRSNRVLTIKSFDNLFFIPNKKQFYPVRTFRKLLFTFMTTPCKGIEQLSNGSAHYQNKILSKINNRLLWGPNNNDKVLATSIKRKLWLSAIRGFGSGNFSRLLFMLLCETRFLKFGRNIDYCGENTYSFLINYLTFLIKKLKFKFFILNFLTLRFDFSNKRTKGTGVLLQSSKQRLLKKIYNYSVLSRFVRGLLASSSSFTISNIELGKDFIYKNNEVGVPLTNKNLKLKAIPSIPNLSIVMELYQNFVKSLRLSNFKNMAFVDLPVITHLKKNNLIYLKSRVKSWHIYFKKYIWKDKVSFKKRKNRWLRIFYIYSGTLKNISKAKHSIGVFGDLFFNTIVSDTLFRYNVKNYFNYMITNGYSSAQEKPLFFKKLLNIHNRVLYSDLGIVKSLAFLNKSVGNLYKSDILFDRLFEIKNKLLFYKNYSIFYKKFLESSVSNKINYFYLKLAGYSRSGYDFKKLSNLLRFTINLGLHNSKNILLSEILKKNFDKVNFLISQINYYFYLKESLLSERSDSFIKNLFYSERLGFVIPKELLIVSNLDSLMKKQYLEQLVHTVSKQPVKSPKWHTVSNIINTLYFESTVNNSGTGTANTMLKKFSALVTSLSKTNYSLDLGINNHFIFNRVAAVTSKRNIDQYMKKRFNYLPATQRPEFSYGIKFSYAYENLEKTGKLNDLAKKLFLKISSEIEKKSYLNYQSKKVSSYFWDIENKRIFLKSQKKNSFLKKKDKIRSAKKITKVLCRLRESRINSSLFLNYIINNKNLVDQNLYQYLFSYLSEGGLGATEIHSFNFFFKKYSYFKKYFRNNYRFDNRFTIKNRRGFGKIYLNGWMDGTVNSHIKDGIVYNLLVKNKFEKFENKANASISLFSKNNNDPVENLFNLFKFKSHKYLECGKILESFCIPNMEKVLTIFNTEPKSKYGNYYKNVKYLSNKDFVLPKVQTGIKNIFNSAYQKVDPFEIKHIWNPADQTETEYLVDGSIADMRYIEMSNFNFDYDNFHNNSSSSESVWKYFIQQDSQYIDDVGGSSTKYLSWARNKLLENFENHFFSPTSDRFLLDGKVNAVLPNTDLETESIFKSKPITLYSDYTKSNHYGTHGPEVLERYSVGYSLNLDNINMFEDRLLSGLEKFTSSDYLKILENDNNWWTYSNIKYHDKDSKGDEVGRVPDNSDGTFFLDFDYNNYLQETNFGYFYGNSELDTMSIDYDFKSGELFDFLNLENYDDSIYNTEDYLDFDEDISEITHSDLIFDEFFDKSIVDDKRLKNTNEVRLSSEISDLNDFDGDRESDSSGLINTEEIVDTGIGDSLFFKKNKKFKKHRDPKKWGVKRFRYRGPSPSLKDLGFFEDPIDGSKEYDLNTGDDYRSNGADLGEETTDYDIFGSAVGETDNKNLFQESEIWNNLDYSESDYYSEFVNFEDLKEPDFEDLEYSDYKDLGGSSLGDFFEDIENTAQDYVLLKFGEVGATIDFEYPELSNEYDVFLDDDDDELDPSLSGYELESILENDLENYDEGLSDDDYADESDSEDDDDSEDEDEEDDSEDYDSEDEDEEYYEENSGMEHEDDFEDSEYEEGDRTNIDWVFSDIPEEEDYFLNHLNDLGDTKTTSLILESVDNDYYKYLNDEGFKNSDFELEDEYYLDSNYFTDAEDYNSEDEEYYEEGDSEYYDSEDEDEEYYEWGGFEDYGSEYEDEEYYEWGGFADYDSEDEDEEYYEEDDSEDYDSEDEDEEYYEEDDSEDYDYEYEEYYEDDDVEIYGAQSVKQGAEHSETSATLDSEGSEDYDSEDEDEEYYEEEEVEEYDDDAADIENNNEGVERDRDDSDISHFEDEVFDFDTVGVVFDEIEESEDEDDDLEDEDEEYYEEDDSEDYDSEDEDEEYYEEDDSEDYDSEDEDEEYYEEDDSEDYDSEDEDEEYYEEDDSEDYDSEDEDEEYYEEDDSEDYDSEDEDEEYYEEDDSEDYDSEDEECGDDSDFEEEGSDFDFENIYYSGGKYYKSNSKYDESEYCYFEYDNLLVKDFEYSGYGDKEHLNVDSLEDEHFGNESEEYFHLGDYECDCYGMGPNKNCVCAYQSQHYKDYYDSDFDYNTYENREHFNRDTIEDFDFGEGEYYSEYGKENCNSEYWDEEDDSEDYDSEDEDEEYYEEDDSEDYDSEDEDEEYYEEDDSEDYDSEDEDEDPFEFTDLEEDDYDEDVEEEDDEDEDEDEEYEDDFEGENEEYEDSEDSKDSDFEDENEESSIWDDSEDEECGDGSDLEEEGSDFKGESYSLYREVGDAVTDFYWYEWGSNFENNGPLLNSSSSDTYNNFFMKLDSEIENDTDDIDNSFDFGDIFNAENTTYWNGPNFLDNEVPNIEILYNFYNDSTFVELSSQSDIREDNKTSEYHFNYTSPKILKNQSDDYFVWGDYFYKFKDIAKAGHRFAIEYGGTSNSPNFIKDSNNFGGYKKNLYELDTSYFNQTVTSFSTDGQPYESKYVEPFGVEDPWFFYEELSEMYANVDDDLDFLKKDQFSEFWKNKWKVPVDEFRKFDMSDIRDDFMSVDVLDFVNKHIRISEIGGDYIENFFDKETFRVEDEDELGYNFFDEFFEDDYNFLSKPKDSTIFEKKNTGSQNFEIQTPELVISENDSIFGTSNWPSLPEGDIKGLVLREDLIGNTIFNGPVSLLNIETGLEIGAGRYDYPSSKLQAVGLNSILSKNKQKGPGIGISDAESSDILNFLGSTLELEVKDREYSMMEFSEDLSIIPEFSYWLQDSDFSDVFWPEDVEDSSDQLSDSILKNTLFLKNYSDERWSHPDYKNQIADVHDSRRSRPLRSKSWVYSENLHKIEDLSATRGSAFEPTYSTYADFWSIDDNGRYDWNLPHLDMVSGFGLEENIAPVDFNNYSGFVKKNYGFSKLSDARIFKERIFGEVITNPSFSEEFVNGDGLYSKSSDSAPAFSSFNQLQKFLKSNSKNVSNSDANNIDSIRTLFSHFFESSESGDTISDVSFPTNSANRLLWLSYIDPIESGWSMLKSIRTHSYLRSLEPLSNHLRYKEPKHFDFYGYSTLFSQNKDWLSEGFIDRSATGTDYDDNSTIFNLTTLGIPNFEHGNVSISTTDADAYLRPVSNNVTKFRHTDLPNSLKKTIVSNIYNTFSSQKSRESFIDDLNHVYPHFSFDKGNTFEHEDNSINYLSNDTKFSYSVGDSTDYDNFSNGLGSGFGSEIPLSDYLDLDMFSRDFYNFWSKKEGSYDFNMRETLRLSRWRSSMKDTRPVIFNAYGSFGRGYSHQIKPKFWWVPTDFIDDWLSKDKKLAIKQFDKKYKDLYKSLDTKIVEKLLKKINPFDSFESDGLGLNIGSKLRNEISGKYGYGKLVSSYNYKTWKKITENKPLRRLLSRYSNDIVSNRSLISLFSAWSSTLRKLDLGSLSFYDQKNYLNENNTLFSRAHVFENINKNIMYGYRPKSFSNKYSVVGLSVITSKRNNFLSKNNFNSFGDYFSNDSGAILLSEPTSHIGLDVKNWLDFSNAGKQQTMFWENYKSSSRIDMLKNSTLGLELTGYLSSLDTPNVTNYENHKASVFAIREFRLSREKNPFFEDFNNFIDLGHDFKKFKKIENLDYLYPNTGKYSLLSSQLFCYKNTAMLCYKLANSLSIFLKIISFFQLYAYRYDNLSLHILMEMHNILTIWLCSKNIEKDPTLLNTALNTVLTSLGGSRTEKIENTTGIIISRNATRVGLSCVNQPSLFLMVLIRFFIWKSIFFDHPTDNFFNFFIKKVWPITSYTFCLEGGICLSERRLFFKNNLKDNSNSYNFGGFGYTLKSSNLVKKVHKITNNFDINIFDNKEKTLYKNTITVEHEPNIQNIVVSSKDALFELDPTTDGVSFVLNNNTKIPFTGSLDTTELFEGSPSSSTFGKKFYNVFEWRRWSEKNKKIIIGTGNFSDTEIDWISENQITSRKQLFQGKFLSKNRFKPVGVFLNPSCFNDYSLFKIQQGIPEMFSSRPDLTKRIPLPLKNAKMIISSFNIFNVRTIKQTNNLIFGSTLRLEKFKNINTIRSISINKKTILGYNISNRVGNSLFFWKNKIANNLSPTFVFPKISNIWTVSSYLGTKMYSKYNYFDKHKPSSLYNEVGVGYQSSIKNHTLCTLLNNLENFKKIKTISINIDKVLTNSLLGYNRTAISSSLAKFIIIKNTESVNRYWWNIRKNLKNFGNVDYLKKNEIDARLIVAKTLMSELQSNSILGIENNNVDFLNGLLVSELSKISSNFSTAKNLSKITINDGSVSVNYLNYEKIVKSSMDLFIENSLVKENNYLSFSFSKAISIFDFFSKIYSYSPEAILYNLWSLVTFEKKIQEYGNSKFIENMFFVPGHINTQEVDIFLKKKYFFFKKTPSVFYKNYLKFNQNTIINNSPTYGYDRLKYREWSKNFGILENKFENVNIHKKNIESKLSNTTKFSSYLKTNSSILESSESVLQRFEQLLINHTGSNFLKEIIFSHYGSWIPKYGFFTKSKTLNPDFLSYFSIEQSKTMDRLINSGDWVGYFEYKNSIKNQGESNFIKKYIFVRSLYISKCIHNNFEDYSSVFNKKLKYRPFDSYVSISKDILEIGDVSELESYAFRKIWGWLVRDDFALRQNYFKNWYAYQLSLEKNDILTYGNILPKTLKNRQSNPEFLYIVNINNCGRRAVHEFIKNNPNFIDNFNRFEFNKYLRFEILKCLSNNENLFLNSNVAPIADFSLNIADLNQSEVTEFLSEHEKQVNTFRILDWKKKKTKLK